MIGDYILKILYYFSFRQLFIPSSKNNSFKSFAKSYFIEVNRAISFSDNVKVHIISNNSDLGNEGASYSFPISIIPDKIGEISTMVVIYLNARRKDGLGKSFEKIIPFEIKANVPKFLLIINFLK